MNLPPPPVNQPVLTDDGKALSPHWKQWFVDLHKLVQDQARLITDLQTADSK